MNKVRLISTCPVFLLLSLPQLSSADQVTASEFSFGVPSSFHLADSNQSTYLKQIAEREFSLDHLTESHQELVSQALRTGGIEVDSACSVEKRLTTDIRVFMKRESVEAHEKFHPHKGMKDLAPKEGQTSDWRAIAGDSTAYPYPFSEDQVISKTVPVNLSTVQLKGDREGKNAVYTSHPSELLYAKLSERDRLIPLEKMELEFEIDTESKQLIRQKLRLLKPQRVYFGIKIRKLELAYDFEQNDQVNRNVMVSQSQYMGGRLWLVSRPRFEIDASFDYDDCDGEIPETSYLYQSIAAIASLP